MADTDEYKPYTRRPFPKIEGSEEKFIQEELTRIQLSFRSVLTILQALEARIKTLEP